jgi:signal transduction histidine kinase
MRKTDEPKMTQKSPAASVMVQEIRNPLTAMSLALEMLNSTIINADDEQKIYLDIIERGSKKINNMIADFLVRHEVNELHSKMT